MKKVFYGLIFLFCLILLTSCDPKEFSINLSLLEPEVTLQDGKFIIELEEYENLVLMWKGELLNLPKDLELDLKYKVILSENENLSSPLLNVGNIEEETYTIDLEELELERGKVYYWKIIAEAGTKSVSIEGILYIKEIYQLTLTGENINAIPELSDYLEGTEIKITVIPEEGKEVKTFTVNEIDKKAELLEDPKYEYNFIITENTAIEVTYEFLEEPMIFEEALEVEISLVQLSVPIIERDLYKGTFIRKKSEVKYITLLSLDEEEEERVVNPSGFIEIPETGELELEEIFVVEGSTDLIIKLYNEDKNILTYGQVQLTILPLEIENLDLVRKIPILNINEYSLSLIINDESIIKLEFYGENQPVIPNEYFIDSSEVFIEKFRVEDSDSYFVIVAKDNNDEIVFQLTKELNQ
jgi:hypothetical protein